MSQAQWLFGDQLGPHFDLGGPLVLIESKSHFARHRYHRQKAHLILSAMRHRTAESSNSRYVRADTYAQGLTLAPASECVHPHSRGALTLARRQNVQVVKDSPGFLSTREDFSQWANGRKRMLLEDWYRFLRKKHHLLMDGDSPVGGAWNFDEENRLPPPKGRERLLEREPWAPREDDIDAQVRRDLDEWEREGIEFRGQDAARQFPVTRAEALLALDDFISHRLKNFGPFEDAMMKDDPVLAHSMLSVPLNLGILDPREVVERVIAAYRQGDVPIQSAEGFIRQIVGWREYMWQLYWFQGASYEHLNELEANINIPPWFRELKAHEVSMNCVHEVLERVNRTGWLHHIERLMILSNWCLQRGYSPQEVDHWFRELFVDAYPWVMVGNVIGMGLFADGGVLATKPYAAGGAYISRMSNYCKGCRFDPKVRQGEAACPFTAGYWYFLDRNRDRLRGNHRIMPMMRALDRLADIDNVRHQEERRAQDAP